MNPSPAMRDFVDHLIAGDRELQDVAGRLDEDQLAVCLAVVLTSVLELRLGTTPTWEAIATEARRVWVAGGEREQLLVIEAVMRASCGFSRAVLGLMPNLLADAVGAIIEIELDLAAGDEASMSLANLRKLARSRLSSQPDAMDG